MTTASIYLLHLRGDRLSLSGYKRVFQFHYQRYSQYFAFSLSRIFVRDYQIKQLPAFSCATIIT